MPPTSALSRFASASKASRSSSADDVAVLEVGAIPRNRPLHRQARVPDRLPAARRGHATSLGGEWMPRADAGLAQISTRNPGHAFMHTGDQRLNGKVGVAAWPEVPRVTADRRIAPQS